MNLCCFGFDGSGGGTPVAETLAQTLVAGNVTGGTSIVVTSGDTINYSVGAGGILTSATTTSQRTWTLPNATGTIPVGSGTANRVVQFTAANEIGNGTWSFSTNDLLPVTTGSNIGGASNRVGTTYLSGGFDYSGSVIWVSGATTYATLDTSGRWGINASVSSTNRMNITAGASMDGAINISASNMNDNGYGILVQGGGASTTFSGFWCDVTVAASGTSYAVRGSASLSNTNNNYGGSFTARNGTTTSIGVLGDASGGDSVNPSFASVGVQGSARSVVATDRRAGYFYTDNNVNSGTSYAVKAESSTGGTNAVNYGIHSVSSGSGASVTNRAGYFKAAGGSSATNYAIITDGGNSGFSQTTPTALLHLGAGTASASSAPLKFTSGTNMTNAEAGAMEYASSDLFFTKSGTTRGTVLVSTAATTEVVVTDTTLTVTHNGTTYKILARAV